MSLQLSWENTEALAFDADSFAKDSLNQQDDWDTEKFISVQEFNIENPLLKDVLKKAEQMLENIEATHV
jgi:asparagine synthetase A